MSWEQDPWTHCSYCGAPLGRYGCPNCEGDEPGEEEDHDAELTLRDALEEFAGCPAGGHANRWIEKLGRR